MLFADMLGMVVVGMLWGCTNVALRTGATHAATKSASHGSHNKNHGRVRQAMHDLVGTLLDWRFTLPFALNQSGSLVYYYLLGSSGECDALADT
jgi:hypothetical protein